MNDIGPRCIYTASSSAPQECEDEAHFSQNVTFFVADDCFWDYRIKIKQNSQWHEIVMFICVLSGPSGCGYQATFSNRLCLCNPVASRRRPHRSAVFSLLISKQSFKKSSEIAPSSSVLRRRRLRAPRVRCLNTTCPSSSTFFLTRSTCCVYSIFFLPSSSSTRASLQVHQTVISSVTEDLTGRAGYWHVNKYLCEGSHSAAPLGPRDAPSL